MGPLPGLGLHALPVSPSTSPSPPSGAAAPAASSPASTASPCCCCGWRARGRWPTRPSPRRRRRRAAPGGRGPSAPASRAVRPEAQARRRAQRIALMDAGIDDFERWLQDLVRQGLAAARAQPYALLGRRRRPPGRRPAARPGRAGPGDGRRGAPAARLGRPPDRRGGALVPGRAGLAPARRLDAGRRRRPAGRARLADRPATRCWRGSGCTTAGWWPACIAPTTAACRPSAPGCGGWDRAGGRCILDFAAAGGSLAVAQVTGTVVDAEVALYPGSEPRRAMLADDPASRRRRARSLGGTTVDRRARRGGRRRGRQPVGAAGARGPRSAGPASSPTGVVAVEPGGGRRPVDRVVATTRTRGPRWPCTGGHPTAVFGEWEHGALRLLTVADDDGLVPV